MRTIKFRAWSRRHEKYINPSEFVIDSTGGVFWGNVDLDKSTFEIRNWILEQYTGLKDKNGNEIYEGDIIKFFGGNKKNKAKNEFGVIVYKADRYGAGFNSIIQNKEHGYGGINIAQDIVVGNVHTNPELLEE